MITTRLEGGLGNQMFQYAAIYSLSLDKKCGFSVDLSWFKIKNIASPRSYELDIFHEIQALRQDNKYLGKDNFLISMLVSFRNLYIKRLVKTVREPCFNYWDGIHKVNGHTKFVGYWQSEKYFKHNRDIILKSFTFPEVTEPHNIKYLKFIENIENSVSLHVRRGDYISDANANARHGCCDMYYYEQAISTLDSICDDTHYFIFSDDPEWVKDAFELKNMTIIVGNSDELSFRDMQLMSLCKHHVIANSTFSWWGAWLSKNEGTVIAPKNWFADSSIDTSDIYCEGWLRL